MTGIPDFTTMIFLAPPSGVGAQVRLDGDGLVRAIDTIIQGWMAGKISLGEGDLLPSAFGKKVEWVSFTTQSALAKVLQWVAKDFLPRISADVAAISAQYPEVQKVASNTMTKLEERARTAGATMDRYSLSIPSSPLRVVMNDYTSVYTTLGVAKAMVPPDEAAVTEAQKRLAKSYEAVIAANDTLKAGINAITSAARRFISGFAGIIPAKVTPAQRRTAQEYLAAAEALKGAWTFPTLSPIPRAAFPATRGMGRIGKFRSRLGV